MTIVLVADPFFFYVDLEHEGKYCGILQLSVVAYYNPIEAKVIDEFDSSYIKLPASAIWSDHQASSVHGIYQNDTRI